MRYRIVRSLLAAVILGLTVSPGPAAAQIFRGVDFPQGAASFADAVVAYAPDLQYPLRSDVKNPGEALGPPDDVTGIPAEYVSLGNGGSLTLRFVNNALTGSGNANKDLWIFEIGPLVEDTSVAISRDGVAWIEVGTVAGSTSGSTSTHSFPIRQRSIPSSASSTSLRRMSTPATPPGQTSTRLGPSRPSSARPTRLLQWSLSRPGSPPRRPARAERQSSSRRPPSTP